MHTKSWLWVRDRVHSLLSTPPSFAVDGKDRRLLIPSTRLQWALFDRNQKE